MRKVKVKIYLDERVIPGNKSVCFEIEELERKENEYGVGNYLAITRDDGYEEVADYRYMGGYSFIGAVEDLINCRYGDRIKRIEVDVVE